MKKPVGNPVVRTESGELVELSFTKLDKESKLDDLVVQQPSLLQIEQINIDFADPELVIPQFGVDGNWVDVLLVNKEGRITIVESKLQKNPEAKRKVFGQILDYATSIHNLDYETFSAKCAQFAKHIDIPRGVDDPLTSMMEELCDGFDASAFRKKVTNGLELGRFLLIILGDEVHGELAEMVRFLTDHSELGFELAAVECMHFESKDQNQQHKIVVPRVVEVFSREFIRWEPDQNSVAAQELNAVPKSRPGRRKSSLSDVEKIAAFRSEITKLELGSQLLKNLEKLTERCSNLGFTEVYKSSGTSFIMYYDEPKWEGDELFNLFQCSNKGKLNGTFFLQHKCNRNGLPDSIWKNHWEKLEAITGAGTLVIKSETLTNNRHSFLDKNGNPPSMMDVLGANGEHVEAITQLLGETANAIMVASEQLDD